MGRVFTIAAAVVLASGVAPLASAQEAASAACRAPSRDHALKLRAGLDDLMKLASAPLEGKKSLEAVKGVSQNVRSALPVLRCDEPAMAGKELAELQAFATRANAWADRQDARIAAEEAGRASIVVPLCEAVWGVENAKADIAREKANPSGIVDLAALHSAGNAVQHWQSIVDALKPQYLALRHHPFASWQNEGACVAAAAANQ